MVGLVIISIVVIVLMIVLIFDCDNKLNETNERLSQLESDYKLLKDNLDCVESASDMRWEIQQEIHDDLVNLGGVYTKFTEDVQKVGERMEADIDKIYAAHNKLVDNVNELVEKHNTLGKAAQGDFDVIFDSHNELGENFNSLVETINENTDKTNLYRKDLSDDVMNLHAAIEDLEDNVTKIEKEM